MGGESFLPPPEIDATRRTGTCLRRSSENCVTWQLPAERADSSRDATAARATGARGALPDILAPDLHVLFCGINPGRASAAAGAHFANPRNDFWRLLHATGFTPRLLAPGEQHELTAYGCGLTNAAQRTTRGSGDLRRADFAGTAERLARLAAELRPRMIAFVGKEAYRGAFGRRPLLGLQEHALASTRLFVLPSTSPANAAVSYAERLGWFRELRSIVPGTGPHVPEYAGGAPER